MTSYQSTTKTSLFLELDLLRGKTFSLETYGDSDFAIEGLGIITKVFDLFGRVMNNFKHNTLSLSKTVKRSELRAYVESHSASIKTLMRQPDRVRLEAVIVPLPDGMVLPYQSATDILLALYDKCRTKEVISLLTTILNKHLTTDPAQWAELTSEIAHASIEAEHISKDDVQKALGKIFATHGHGRELSATAVMGSTVAQINTVTDRILRFEAIYEETATVHNEMTKLDKVVDNLVAVARSSGAVISRAYLQQLADLIRTAAIQFDMHGVIIAEMQRVEHNYTLGLARVVSAAN